VLGAGDDEVEPPPEDRTADGAGEPLERRARGEGSNRGPDLVDRTDDVFQARSPSHAEGAEIDALAVRRDADLDHRERVDAEIFERAVTIVDDRARDLSDQLGDPCARRRRHAA
jgi:hypothetical protein